MADSFTVAARFAFTANFEVLEAVAKAMEQIAAFAEPASKNVSTLNRAFRSGARAAEGFASASAAVDRSLSGITSKAATAAASMQRMATATTAASRASSGGFGSFLGGVGKGVAIAGLATEIVGVHGASSLQDASIQTAIALGRSNKYVSDNLVPLAMQMSMSTAQSISDSMGILRTMATSGINDPAQLRALAMPIAQFADTQYLGKNHVPFDQSAAQLATLAHELNLRTAGQLAPFANTLFKISNDMPDSLKTAATQIKYYGANFANAGVSPSEILMLQATADRLGYGGGKSGTGLNMALRNLQNPSSDKMLAAQSALGLLGPNGRSRFIDQRTGTFNPEALFSYLNTQYNAARRNGTVGNFDQELAKAFSTNASLIVGAFSSNAGMAQRKNVTQTMTRVEDLQKAQIDLMGSLNNQTKLLATNFQTLATLLASPLIAPLTALVSNLAKLTGGAAMYLQGHPETQNIAAGALAIVAAAGAYQALKMLGGIGIFAHAAARLGGESVGVGGWLGRAAHGGNLMGEGGMARLAGMLGRVFPIVGQIGDRFASFGATIVKLVNPLGRIVPLVASWGLKIASGIGDIMLVIAAFQLLRTHSKDIGKALADAAIWIHDKGGPMIASALEYAFTSAIGYAMKSIIPFAIDSVKSNVLDVLGIKHKAVGADAVLEDIFGGGSAAFMAELARSRSGGYDPAFLKRLEAGPGGNGQSVVVNGDLVLPGVKNKEDLGNHFRDFRKKTSLVQGAPVSSKAPAWLTIGKAYGQ